VTLRLGRGLIRRRARLATAFGALFVAGVACQLAIAKDFPIPRARPPQAPREAPEERITSDAPGPSACRLRLSSDIAIAPSLPPITGPGDCQATDVVRLEAVLLPNRSRVAVTPPAILGCPMADAIVSWVRQEVAPRALDLGSPLEAVENLTSFDCRGRNDVAGAKMSEHGKANALDVHSLRLANGKVLALTDPHASKDFRELLRATACARFTTVLGPGSDGFHEDHIHIDLLQRRNGYRICQWDVHEPEAPATVSRPESVPLPRAASSHGSDRNKKAQALVLTSLNHTIQ
jgi:hypothetical protein